MKIAVIMLTFNRLSYSRKTLLNFERQLKGSSDYFFYIYDNGSTDGTGEYLSSYKGTLNLEVVRGEKNHGIANSTKFLLEEKCFDKNYDLIIKTDDDELLPDNWFMILKYYNECEKLDAPFIGFKRKEINREYFEKYGWISETRENLKKIQFDDFECYRSMSSPGVQIGNEYWWKKVYNELTDYSALYGGWDYTFMEALRKLKKYFMVVFNHESDHFQSDKEYSVFSVFKQEEFRKFLFDREKIWENSKKELAMIDKELKELIKSNPQNLHLKQLLEKASLLKAKTGKGK